MRVKIGTRPSPLALAQVEEAVTFLRGAGLEFDFDVVPIASDGDLDKATPLAAVEGTHFFTRQLEVALRQGAIDIAVHSAKDLEDDLPLDLTIALITPTVSPHECLVARQHGSSLETLPAASRMGTSSQKRQEALLRYRPDFVVRGIRGNIAERLAQLDHGDFDAIIVAHAALIRLGFEGRISQIIPPEIMPPHPLQGRIALQIHRERTDLRDLFKEFDET